MIFSFNQLLEFFSFRIGRSCDLGSFETLKHERSEFTVSSRCDMTVMTGTRRVTCLVTTLIARNRQLRSSSNSVFLSAENLTHVRVSTI